MNIRYAFFICCAAFHLLRVNKSTYVNESIDLAATVRGDFCTGASCC